MFGSIKNYLNGRSERRLEKAAVLTKKVVAIKEERMSAIEYLSSAENTEFAIPALLARFDFSLEHGIQDEREKNKAMQGIVQHGDAAVEIVKQHLLTTTKVAWPVKILSKTTSKEFVLDVLKQALDFGDTSFDDNKINKNYDVLCYLRDYALDGFVGKISHFLKDPDERIRFATIEALAEQDDPQLPALFEPFMSDESSENRRIREVVVQTFLSRGWKVQDPSVFVDGVVMPGVRLSKDGTLKNSK